jgi:hypothetical protein
LAAELWSQKISFADLELGEKNDDGSAAMARDLFSGPPVNGKHSPPTDTFRWIVGIFSGDGAPRTIIRANKSDLLTYYPVKMNQHGEPTPLFKNYLFLEWRGEATLDICRATSLFIKVLSARDDDGIVRPILVRRNAVDENRAMVMAGRFNERIINRQFYGKGSIVAVLHGIMATRRVRLEEDILPEWRGNHRVKVDMNGVKGVIEIHKLAL